MAIEVTDGGTLITGNDINLYRLMAIASGLAIEINTGMRLSQVSAMKVAKRVCGSGKGTKARVLADLILFTRERFPHFTPTQTMVRALETLPARQLSKKQRMALGLMCAWFLTCENNATGTVTHPILGEVATCDRCRELASPHPRHAQCADGCGLSVTHDGACLSRPGGRQVCTDDEHDTDL